MLRVEIPGTELYDSDRDYFCIVDSETLTLEHSLLSISKWESKWQKPFLTKDQKTVEESTDYIRCMTLTSNVDPLIYQCITPAIFKTINDYIQSPMSATWFRDDKRRSGRREIVTSELIYYWMVALGIPFECQKWHLNRLLTLIRICNEKNAPPKKMSKRELMNRNTSLNAARRAALHTRG